MNHEHADHRPSGESPQRGKPVAPRGFNFVLIGFLLVAGFFLAMEHRAHLLGILPWLILAACPLMHLFMHGGHGGHGGHGRDSDKS